MKRMRKRQNPETVRTKSRAIAQRLFGLDAFVASRNLLIYMSLPGEVQTGDMIKEALDLGKRVCVPVLAEGGRLDVSEIQSLDLDFAVRALGVREPKDSDRIAVDPKLLDCIVIPGLAFDAQGGRIGFGAGYFDRFLAGVPKTAQRVALAFDFQILESLPQTPQDVPVHCILTETTTINC